MPVMDNEKKTDEIFENEEEKRKQAIMNEQEHSENKTQKIVPFLNIKAEFHQNRIDTLNEKIAVREDKINRNKAKIEKLSDKAERLEDRNKMLKDTFGDNPVIKKIIESNEKKINAIRNEKIPKRQNKIKLHENKINQLSEKRNKIQHKFNRVAALSNVVKSFTVRHTTMRREIFTEAMDKLNAANTDCLKDKLTALQMQKEKLATEYNKPETSSVDKINLAAKIKAVNEKISNINDKISKLARPENQFTEKTEDAVDAAMKVTSDKVSEMPENFNIPDISESVIEAAETVKKTYDLEGKFTVIYTGNIGLAQNLQALLNLAEKVDKTKIQFLIFGDGAERIRLEQYARENNINNVRFEGIVSEQTVYSLLNYVQLAYIPLINSNLKDSVPTKTYEALGAGCPVLMVAAGDAAELMKECKLGVCIDPDKIDDLEDTFNYICKNYNDIMTNKDHARDIVLKHHSRQQCAKELEKILVKLCEG